MEDCEGLTMREIALRELQQIASHQHEINTIYLHWSAGSYTNPSNSYQINITGDGKILLMVNELGDHYTPEDDGYDASNPYRKVSHTYRRNTQAIGISILCCAGAEYYGGTNVEWGEYPPTRAQIEAMAKCVAVLCEEWNLPIDLRHVMTHAEAADNKDGRDPGYEYNGFPNGMYGPENSVERWDLAVLPDEPIGGIKEGGDVIRGKALWFRNEWETKGKNW